MYNLVSLIKKSGVWLMAVTAVFMIGTHALAAAGGGLASPHVRVEGTRTVITGAGHQIVVDRTGEGAYLAAFTGHGRRESVLVTDVAETPNGKPRHRITVTDTRTGRVVLSVLTDRNLMNPPQSPTLGVPSAAIVALITGTDRSALSTLVISCVNYLVNSGILGTILGLWYSGASIWAIASFIIGMMPELLVMFGFAVVL